MLSSIHTGILMTHKKRILLPILLCILLLACNSLWSAANRTSLTANVSEVLTPTDETPPDLTCSMLGTSRSGYCLFPADEARIAEITTRLEMDVQTASLADPSTVPPLITDGETGCLDPELFTSVDGLPAYWLGGRPGQLSLGDGSQFEYMLLLFDAQSGQACVQVSYAYG